MVQRSYLFAHVSPRAVFSAVYSNILFFAPLSIDAWVSFLSPDLSRWQAASAPAEKGFKVHTLKLKAKSSLPALDGGGLRVNNRHVHLPILAHTAHRALIVTRGHCTSASDWHKMTGSCLWSILSQHVVVLLIVPEAYGHILALISSLWFSKTRFWPVKSPTRDVHEFDDVVLTINCLGCDFEKLISIK